MNEDSPRWLMRLPATIYVLVWIGLGTVGIAIGAWMTYGPLRLRGASARLLGIAALMMTMGPLAALLAKSRFRTYALEWERYADLQDAEEKVARFLEVYARTHDGRQIRKSRAVVRKLRQRHPDPVYGQALEDTVAAAEANVGG